MDEKLTDEKIVQFVLHTRQVLDFVEHGIPPEEGGGMFDDGEPDRQ